MPEIGLQQFDQPGAVYCGVFLDQVHCKWRPIGDHAPITAMQRQFLCHAETRDAVDKDGNAIFAPIKFHNGVPVGSDSK